jgi:hypothetical protein
MIGSELGRDSRSRGADAPHLVVIGLPGGPALGHRPRASTSPALPAADLDRGSHAAWPGAATAGQPGAAPMAVPVPSGPSTDRLGISTEAILASERDSGAIGRQNAITASNSASHPWRIR